jgi:hypothetical protein
MRWKAGKLISTELHAKSEGVIRLIPPQGQAVSGIHGANGKSVVAGKDGTIRTRSGITYEILFR